MKVSILKLIKLILVNSKQGGYILIAWRHDLFEALVNYAVKNGIKIACNPGGKEIEHGIEKLKPLLANIDIFITNKEEGISLLGEELMESSEWILDGLQKVVKIIVVLTDGHNGVRARLKDREFNAGVPDSPVVERTGAGDAFGSGFVSEYIRSGVWPNTIRDGQRVVGGDKFGAKAGILKKGTGGRGHWLRYEKSSRL